MVFLALLASLAACVAVAAALSVQSKLKGNERRVRHLEEQVRFLTLRLYAAEKILGHRQEPSAPGEYAPPAASIFVPTAEPPPFPSARTAAEPRKPRARPRVPDMEAIIGGNWLNKLGVLILLIGLALFLGFSLTALSPAGRVAIGWLTGLALLGVGVAAERKPSYRVLGSGLIGGGWAAIYFTTYAAHALDAARIIDSPAVALSLLLFVGFLMVVHSLHFKSQTASGVAFAAAFLALAVSPPGILARPASVPLLLSLLAMAWRFGWQPLAAAGAVFAYTAYGFGLAGDPAPTRWGEPILWIYWISLETFDLLSLRRARTYFPVFIFNALGFLLANILSWPPHHLQEPGNLLLALALAYLGSCFFRLRRRPDASFEDRSAAGGFRAALTLSTLAAVASSLVRLEGLGLLYALTLLAEMVAVAGWWFRSIYVSRFGAALFLLPLIGLAFESRHLSVWWWLALLLLFLFYANRFVLKADRAYTFAAGVVLFILIEGRIAPAYRPLAFTTAAGLTWLGSLRYDPVDLRRLATAQGALSIISLFVQNPRIMPWLTLGWPAAMYYSAALLSNAPPHLRLALNTAGGLFAVAAVHACLPAPWVPLGVGSVALLLWAIGLRTREWATFTASLLPSLAIYGYWFDSEGSWTRLIALGPYFLMLYLPPRDVSPTEHTVRQIHGFTAVILLTAHLGEVISGSRLTLAWGLEAGALLALGFVLRDRFTRLSALSLFLICLVKLFFYDFSQLDVLSRILSFIVLGLLLIGASWVYTRFRRQIRRYL